MDMYLYRVKNDSGQTLVGVTHAQDIKDIKPQFRSAELFFISATRYDPGQFARIKLGLDELLMFNRRLSYLIEAGVPILQSMTILWRQSENKDLQVICSYIRKKIEDGSNLQEAFSAFPKVFPPMYVALIGVAEVGAGMVKALRKIGEYLEAQKRFIERLKRATMYPSFVLGFAFLVVLGMFTFVIPTFQKVILRMHGELPVLTQVLFGMSTQLRSLWFWIFAGVIGIGGFLTWKWAAHIPETRYMIDSWKLQAPLFKQVLYPMCIGRFTRSLSLLLDSGVPLLAAIEVSKTTAGNARIEVAIEEIEKQIVDGGTLHDAFKSTKIFPVILHEMVAIGESSGKLQQLLDSLSSHLEEETDYALNKFLTYLEPLLVITIGGIVLVVMLGIYMPIFSLQNALRVL